MIKRWIFRLELYIDNFKAKRRLKDLNKQKANLEWIIGIELKRASDEEVNPAIDKYNQILKAIEVDKLFMLDLK